MSYLAKRLAPSLVSDARKAAGVMPAANEKATTLGASAEAYPSVADAHVGQ